MGVEPQLVSGTILLDKYRIERELGRGAMGVVVEAVHLQLDERVAIKVLRPDAVADHEARERFLREARAAAKIHCEFAPRITDVGELPNGSPYMVMEVLDGDDLRELLATQGKLDPAMVIDLALQVCVALAEAHAIGIVHRDIKPGNLFVVWGTLGPRVKLVDFGISKSSFGERVDLTTTSALLGTPAYMAPEQWRSASEADARSDLWSLGVVMYELVEGKRPFRADNYAEMCTAVLTEPPVPMTRDAGGLEPVIARCLAKAADDRYPDVPALARDLVPLAKDRAIAEALCERAERVYTRRSAQRLKALTNPPRPASESSRPFGANESTRATVGRADSPDTGLSPSGIEAADTALSPSGSPAMPGTNVGGAPAASSTPRSRRRGPIALAVALVAGVAVFLVARASGDATDGPRRGGTLRTVTKDEPAATMALYSSTQSLSQLAMLLATEHVVEVGIGGDPRASSLVAIWPSPDPQVLVLALRGDAFFEPHACLPKGRVATGDDLAFSIRQAKAIDRLGLVIERLVVSGNVVMIRLAKPAAFYLHELAAVMFVPRELEGCVNLAAMARPAGTGGFRLADKQPSGGIVMEARADYRRPPYLDRVALEGRSNPDEVLLRMRPGAADPVHIFNMREADWAKYLDLAGSPRLRNPIPDVDVVITTVGSQHHTGMFRLQATRTAGPLRDLHLRRAIAYAIDRAAVIATNGLLRLSGPADRFLPSDALGYRPRTPLSHDLERAKAELGRAGFPDGVPELSFAAYERDRERAELVVAQLAKIGIRARLTVIAPSLQPRVMSDGAGFDGVFLMMRSEFRGREIVDLVVDVKFTALSTELQTAGARLLASPDQAQRADAYAEIEARLLDELPAIPIGWLAEDTVIDVWVVRRSVRGFHDSQTRYFERRPIQDLYGHIWVDE